MKQEIRNTIAWFSQIIPLSILQKGNDYPPFMPFYHIVNDNLPEYINSYIVRSGVRFEGELDYLLKHFEAVDLSEIINSPSKSKMHLTFDDGLKECYSIIAPILKRKGIPATFFVNPDFVDNKALFHRFKQAILEKKGLLGGNKKKYFIQETGLLNKIAQQNGIDFNQFVPYMSMAELQDLHADGFTMGSHGLNHSEMWTLTEDEQFIQILDSVNWVSKYFKPSIRSFSFPFTDDGIKETLFQRLYNNDVVDVTFGTAGLKHDRVINHFQRIAIETNRNWSIDKIMHYEYFYYFLRSLIRKNDVLHK